MSAPASENQDTPEPGHTDLTPFIHKALTLPFKICTAKCFYATCMLGYSSYEKFLGIVGC